jgi:predicted DNA-binding transcriptional regulator AlpA
MCSPWHSSLRSAGGSLTRDVAMKQETAELVSAETAAELLGTTPQTLANWRNTGRYALPYVKIGRLVRYRLLDLDAFIQARTVVPHSSKPEGGTQCIS